MKNISKLNKINLINLLILISLKNSGYLALTHIFEKNKIKLSQVITIIILQRTFGTI